MGKYNVGVKELRPRDFWPTMDADCIPPSFRPFIYGKRFCEPCVGNGDLVEHLKDNGAYLKKAYDIEPQGEYAKPCFKKDATSISKEDVADCDMFITNPPFTWEYLQPLLDHLPKLKPTWFLLPADFAHNKRSGPYMANCAWVLSVGRLYWVLDEGVKPVKGKDNFAWFRFHDQWDEETRFVGR